MTRGPFRATAGIRLGGTVSAFAPGSIRLCAAARAKLSGATAIIGVDSLGNRLDAARRMGADHTIESSRIDPVDEIITLCPGGEERMRRLMSVMQSGRVDLSLMVTHRFELDHIEKVYELPVHQRHGVLKVAIALIKRCSRMRLAHRVDRDRCFVTAASIKQGDRPLLSG